MLWSLVKKTEWEPLLSLLSPSFFDVVPIRILFGEPLDVRAAFDAVVSEERFT